MKARIPWTPSKNQKKRMDEVINQSIREATFKRHLDTEAQILWAVHIHFGSGKRKLKKFYKDFNKITQDLLNHYSFDETDAAWLVHKKLGEIGVNVQEWYNEMQKGNEECK